MPVASSITESEIVFPGKPLPATSTVFIDDVSGPAANLTMDWDVIVFNKRWQSAFTELTSGVNVIQWTFCHPAARESFLDWDTAAQGLLTWWVAGISKRGESERTRSIARTCVAVNPSFERMWDAFETEALDRYLKVELPGAESAPTKLLFGLTTQVTTVAPDYCTLAGFTVPPTALQRD
ncbi:hypothetical protein ACQP2U_42735 (plasmid) [Nocardia sp. CA-084685]|uniref:MmyB family transcriptional regulator n=1 Tax=Nocardia sp. CA-084685 TaxID=3239970 RepID=UPI003D974251